MKRLIYVILAALMLITLSACKKDDYALAQSEMSGENWEAAAAILSELEDYQDSKELLTECENNLTYQKATELLDAKDYSQAETMFRSIPAFLDSDSLAELCHDQPLYDDAVIRMEEGKYSDVKDVFESLGDFLDSAEKAEYCGNILTYTEAKDQMYSCDFSTASEGFKSLGDFMDSAALATDSAYRDSLKKALWLNLSLTEANDTELSALSSDFAALGDYLDSAILSDIYELLAEHKYLEAAEMARTLSYNSGVSMLPNYWSDLFSSAASVIIDRTDDDYFLLSHCSALFINGNPREFSLVGPQLSELDLSKCAGNGTGKILVCYHNGAMGNNTYTICTSIMQKLPDKYFPDSLEEVEYVIYIDRGHTITGSYNTGTKAVRLWTKVSVQKYPGGTTVKDAGTAYGGDAPFSFTSSYVPAFYSGSEPSISDNYLKALDYFGIIGRDQGYAYYVNTDGAYIINRATKDEVVTIPETLGGIPVVGIDEDLFSTDANIKEVNLPSTLLYIAPMAFTYCYSLEKVTLPEGLTYLENDVFNYCSELKSIELPSTLKVISSEAFMYTGLKEINLPESLRFLFTNAFNHTNISSLNLPEGLRIFGDMGYGVYRGTILSSMYALRTISLPSSLVDIYGKINSGISIEVVPDTYGDWYIYANNLYSGDDESSSSFSSLPSPDLLPENFDLVVSNLDLFGYRYEYDPDAKCLTIYPFEFESYDLKAIMMEMESSDVNDFAMLLSDYDAISGELYDILNGAVDVVLEIYCGDDLIYISSGGIKTFSIFDE